MNCRIKLGRMIRLIFSIILSLQFSLILSQDYSLEFDGMDEIKIFGDGEQTRDYVFVSDVIDAHISAQSVDSSLTLNIGAGVELSVNFLFREMADILGYILQPLHVRDREGDVKQIALESTLAFEKLSWKPKTSIRRGIEHTLEWIAGQHGL